MSDGVQDEYSGDTFPEEEFQELHRRMVDRCGYDHAAHEQYMCDLMTKILAAHMAAMSQLVLSEINKGQNPAEAAYTVLQLRDHTLAHTLFEMGRQFQIEYGDSPLDDVDVSGLSGDDFKDMTKGETKPDENS